MATEPVVVQKKKKSTRTVSAGKVYIKTSFNNTIITVTDMSGNVVAWSSAGNCGFKGTKKGTPFAAQVAAEKVAKTAGSMGMRQVECYVSGPGSGKDAAIKTIQIAGLRVSAIKDITPLPHNGCRAQKPRRT